MQILISVMKQKKVQTSERPLGANSPDLTPLQLVFEQIAKATVVRMSSEGVNVSEIR